MYWEWLRHPSLTHGHAAIASHTICVESDFVFICVESDFVICVESDFVFGLEHNT